MHALGKDFFITQYKSQSNVASLLRKVATLYYVK